MRLPSPHLGCGCTGCERAQLGGLGVAVFPEDEPFIEHVQPQPTRTDEQKREWMGDLSLVISLLSVVFALSKRK